MVRMVAKEASSFLEMKKKLPLFFAANGWTLMSEPCLLDRLKV